MTAHSHYICRSSALFNSLNNLLKKKQKKKNNSPKGSAKHVVSWLNGKIHQTKKTIKPPYGDSRIFSLSLWSVPMVLVQVDAS